MVIKIKPAKNLIELGHIFEVLVWKVTNTYLL